jgi:hypothetical protein
VRPELLDLIENLHLSIHLQFPGNPAPTV